MHAARASSRRIAVVEYPTPRTRHNQRHVALRTASLSVQQLDSLLWPCFQPKETLPFAVSPRAPWERPEIGVRAANVHMALAIRHAKLGCSMTLGRQHTKENEVNRQCSLDADCPRRTPSKCAAGSSFGISLTG